jgi:hypothetical protein
MARNSCNEEILNKGLEFALEFGKNWQQPVQSRLAKNYPTLNADELNSYNEICRKVMTTGHQYIYRALESATLENKKIKTSHLAADLKLFLHKDYPWISSDNLKSIHNQGCYYAWKDGLADSIA